MRMKAVLYEHVVFTLLINLVNNAIEVGLDYVVDLAVDPTKTKKTLTLQNTFESSTSIYNIIEQKNQKVCK